MSYFFTSESVTEGHPDKLCDQISDAVLDEALRQDPHAHVGCECIATGNLVIVAGETRMQGKVDVPCIVREVIREVGYTDSRWGFTADGCEIQVNLHRQSADIALGVDEGGKSSEQQGAGDQGLMFGFACRETPEYMPLPISLAHRLCRRLAEVRSSKILTYLGPDGKSQVTVEYSTPGSPRRVDAIVLSAQHREEISHEQIASDLLEHVIHPVCGRYLDARTVYHINPTGRFVCGGPIADSGLTGRKIMVDTYGGYARHGGGAFSGKDPSKVDRSAAYAARWIAKHIVASGLADRCEVQVAYAIGVAEPVSIRVDTLGTAMEEESVLEQAVRAVFDLRPATMIRDLHLLRPQYRKLAAYGHVGREDLPVQWEEVSRSEELRRAVERLTRGARMHLPLTVS